MTVQQAAFERIFHTMGYASSTDYATKKAQQELLHELKVSVERVAAFEKKYGLTYDEFYKRFHELTQFGLFEREDDIMEWRLELQEIKAVEKLLAQLVS